MCARNSGVSDITFLFIPFTTFTPLKCRPILLKSVSPLIHNRHRYLMLRESRSVHVMLGREWLEYPE